MGAEKMVKRTSSMIFLKLLILEKVLSEGTLISLDGATLDKSEKEIEHQVTFLEEGNVTVLTAHLNGNTMATLYRLHSKKTMIDERPEKCIFSDDFEEIGTNNINIQREISTVPIEISLEGYPDVIQKACANKAAFGQEYDLTDLTNGYDTVEVPMEELKKRVRRFSHGRTRRSIRSCRRSRCGGMMMAQCVPHGCSGYIPRYQGTMHASVNMLDHFQSREYFCMPCCYDDTNYWRMPRCGQLTTSSNLCTWYKNNGRC